MPLRDINDYVEWLKARISKGLGRSEFSLESVIKAMELGSRQPRTQLNQVQPAIHFFATVPELMNQLQTLE